MEDKSINNQTNTGGTILDRIVTALTNEQTGSMFLEECDQLSPSMVRKIPLRYRIIAFGFAKRLTLDELNSLLGENNCAKLYSRSIWEASLIYAFSNSLSYTEWRGIRDQCSSMRARKELRDQYFCDSSISLSNIRDYLEANSTTSESTMGTRHLTKMLDKKILELSRSSMTFNDFLVQNVMLMSTVREKSRYYFCKYLYYYLISCRNRYLELRGTVPSNEALSEISSFKGLTRIKRKHMSDEEIISLLDTSGISLGELFDAFNYFFFGYISLDWMEVLLEYYGVIDKLPPDEKTELAASLRKYDPVQYRGLSDEEVLQLKKAELDQQEAELDKMFCASTPGKTYQMNRAGENTIRKYLKGSLDIDRTTLLCFLLFFGNSSDLPKEMEISQERLNIILTECGFLPLRGEDDFDDFVLGYIEASDTTDYLMNLATDYALDEENFFLYRMYKASRSAEADFIKIN